MGKKEKSGKKKGPLKIFSKCFFWGNKRKSEKDHKQDSSLKRSHSESSLTNNQHSDNHTVATTEQDLDPKNVGECSSNHRHSHFQLYCDISEGPESHVPEKLTSDSESLQTNKILDSDLKETTKNKTLDTNIETKNSQVNNTEENYESSKFQEITADSEQGDVNRYDVNTTKYQELKATNGASEKEINGLKNASLLQPSVTPVNRTDGQKIYQPNLDSTSSATQHSNSPLSTYSITYRKGNKTSSYELNSTTEQQSSQLSGASLDFIKNGKQNKPEAFKHNLSSFNNTIKTVEKHWEAEKSSFSSADCTDKNEEKSDERHVEPSSNTINSHNNAIAQHSERVSSQSNVSTTSDIDDSVTKPSEVQISQHNVISVNNVTDINEINSDVERYQSINTSIEYTSKVEAQHIESQENQVVVNKECSDIYSKDFFVKNQEIEMLVDDKEEPDADNTKESCASTGKACDKEKNLSTCHDQSSDNDSNSLSLDEVNLSSYETVDREVLNDDFMSNNSHVKSEDEMMSSMTEILENSLNNQVSLNSSSQTSSQELDAEENNESCFQDNSAEQYTASATKCNGECLKNKNEAPLVETYPSISITKGTSDTGMTLVVLPYVNTTGGKENWKVLSDQTKIGSANDNESTEEKQISGPNNEPVKEHEKISPQRNTGSVSPVKHSRLPIRKQTSSEHISDRISKSSNEIEELNSNVKQKSTDNKLRTNSTNRSVSRIPRKY